jgi:serine/threonine protein phosphatase 1
MTIIGNRDPRPDRLGEPATRPAQSVTTGRPDDRTTGPQVTFIGDVHGWSDRLDRVAAQAEGELVFMGDLIDRGPDSQGVIKRVRTWCEQGRARCLMGNHEWALCRSLAAPGVPPLPGLFEAWTGSWGGAAVLASYGAGDAQGLRTAMGDDLIWLASLPWVLTGGTAQLDWIAVHAGLDDTRTATEQVAQLSAGWRQDQGERPLALFSKVWLDTRPGDLAPTTCIVSGHTPMTQPVVTPGRILCDTSGGRPQRPLTGVVWPSGRIIQG